MALDVCPRLGLTPEETETVSWLVRQHLLMSKTAFRYDLNDPKTINDFAAVVQSPERLKLLLVLTVADIRGVGPTIWNGWKAALMRDLYYQTDAVLRGADAAVIAASSAEDARELTRAELVSWSDEEFADYAAKLPRNYWTGFDTDMHVRHAGLGRRFSDMDVPLLTDFRQVAERKVTELTLLTVDDAGLFSRVAGAVAGLGINIIGARITTCTDGTVLDVFQPQTADNELVSDTHVLERLQDGITGAVTGTLRPQAALDERWRSLPARVRRLPDAIACDPLEQDQFDAYGDRDQRTRLPGPAPQADPYACRSRAADPDGDRFDLWRACRRRVHVKDLGLQITTRPVSIRSATGSSLFEQVDEAAA